MFALPLQGKAESTKEDTSDARSPPAEVTGDQSEGESFEDESTSGESAGGGAEEGDKEENRNGETVTGQSLGLHPLRQEERGDNSLSLRAQLMQVSLEINFDVYTVLELMIPCLLNS